MLSYYYLGEDHNWNWLGIWCGMKFEMGNLGQGFRIWDLAQLKFGDLAWKIEDLGWGLEIVI